MGREELEALALRCEGAGGADREMDAEIAVAIYSAGGHDDPRDNTSARAIRPSDECALGTYWISAFSGLSLRTAAAYTASLDAAMTLAGDDPYSLLVEALLRCPEATVAKDLPRFLTAAFLRARATQEPRP